MKNEILNLPNMLTMVRIALIPVVCVFLAFETPVACLIACGLFVIASLTDLVDGYLARSRGLVTMTGKLLDPLADKLIVMASLLMLVELEWFPAWLVIVVLARELAITGLRSIATGEGIVIAAGKGGKYKTAFQLTGLCFLIAHYQYPLDFFLFSGTVSMHRVGFTLFLVSVFFGLWSAVVYTRGFYRAIGKQKASPA